MLLYLPVIIVIILVACYFPLQAIALVLIVLWLEGL